MKQSQALRLIKVLRTGVLQSIKFFVSLAQEKHFFLLLILLFLFLPGENFYESLRLKFKESLVRKNEVVLPQLLDYPVNVKGARTLFLTAKSAIIVDVSSKVAIFTKEPHARLSPASTTKIMTALVALKNYELDDILTVSNLDSLIGRNMKLFEGEKISVESLLYGLLVHSANDAALTLASSYSSGIEEFIDSMNETANELGLFNTHFTDISGLDRPDHYSTVRDLAHLTAYAMEDSILARMVGVSGILVSDTSKKYWHKLETTNELIGKIPGLKGVKTGWTEKAGECLISYIERDNKKIIVVLLGSQDRFGETKKLIEWVFANYNWQEITLSTQD